MKQLKKTIKEKKIIDMQKEVQDMRHEISKLLLEKKSKPQTNTNFIQNKKRHIALLLTKIQEIKDLELLKQN